MFINTYYLHWEDWPKALPYPSLPPITPPSLTPRSTCGLYKESQAGHTHTTIFNADTLGGRIRPPPSIKSTFTPKTPSCVLSLRNLK